MGVNPNRKHRNDSQCVMLTWQLIPIARRSRPTRQSRQTRQNRQTRQKTASSEYMKTSQSEILLHWYLLAATSNQVKTIPHQVPGEHGNDSNLWCLWSFLLQILYTRAKAHSLQMDHVSIGLVGSSWYWLIKWFLQPPIIWHPQVIPYEWLTEVGYWSDCSYLQTSFQLKRQHNDVSTRITVSYMILTFFAKHCLILQRIYSAGNVWVSTVCQNKIECQINYPFLQLGWEIMLKVDIKLHNPFLIST